MERSLGLCVRKPGGFTDTVAGRGDLCKLTDGIDETENLRDVDELSDVRMELIYLLPCSWVCHIANLNYFSSYRIRSWMLANDSSHRWTRSSYLVLFLIMFLYLRAGIPSHYIFVSHTTAYLVFDSIL